MGKNGRGYQTVDLISVIIPVYQVEKYLAECVDSVLHQTYTNMEIILVDDGSKDFSGMICESYKKQDDRIRVIHIENQGSSGARNAGLKIAKGNYICFIDSDDKLACNYLERLYQLIQMYHAQIAVCDFSNNEKDFNRILTNQAQIENISSHHMLKEWHGRRKYLETVVWNKLYDRCLFDSYLGLQPFPVGRLHEDILVSHLFVEKAKSIVITNEKLYFYRKRNDSISKSSSKENKIQDLYAQKQRMDYFRKHHCIGAYIRLLFGHELHKIKYIFYCEKGEISSEK